MNHLEKQGISQMDTTATETAINGDIGLEMVIGEADTTNAATPFFD